MAKVESRKGQTSEIRNHRSAEKMEDGSEDGNRTRSARVIRYQLSVNRKIGEELHGD